MNLTTKEQDTFLQNVVDNLQSGSYYEHYTIDKLLDIISYLDDIASEFQEQITIQDRATDLARGIKEVFEAARIIIDEETKDV